MRPRSCNRRGAVPLQGQGRVARIQIIASIGSTANEGVEPTWRTESGARFGVSRAVEKLSLVESALEPFHRAEVIGCARIQYWTQQALQGSVIAWDHVGLERMTCPVFEDH